MAKAATESQFEQVNALYEERQRFESWLAALEAKRATTPVHIYTRVYADYGSRLQRVVEELRTHRTALQELESTLIDRLTALDGEEAKHRDEAAEAELRATVGELAADHFTEVTERTSAAIARLGEERTQLQSELSQLRHLLDVGTAPLPVATPGSEPPRAEAPSAAPSSAPPRDWELAFEHAAGSTSAPARASVPRPAEKPEVNPFDDLEFLKTMGDRNSGEHRAVSGAAPAAAQPPAASPPAAPAPEPMMPPAPAARSHPPEPVPAAASLPPVIVPDAPAPPQPEPRVSQPTARDAIPSYLKDSPPEQVKTLKCQECGTLNYPTEWYCERCGAELAAL
jgi:hypothetical protein